MSISPNLHLFSSKQKKFVCPGVVTLIFGGAVLLICSWWWGSWWLNMSNLCKVKSKTFFPFLMAHIFFLHCSIKKLFLSRAHAMWVPGTGYHPARILTSGTIRLQALSPLIIICHALSLREMKTRVENDIVFAKQDNRPIPLQT